MDVPVMRTCTRDDCQRPHRARGLCANHYRHEYGRSDRYEDVACANCGTMARKKVASDRSLRYCSPECFSIHQSQLRQGNTHYRDHNCRVPDDHPSRWIGDRVLVVYGACPICDGVHVSPAHNSRVYCSESCFRRAFNKRRGGRRRRRRVRNRAVVFERDGYLCWLCSTPTDPEAEYLHPLFPTMDHLTPRAHGGGDEPENLRTAHRICNSIRRDQIEVASLPVPVV